MALLSYRVKDKFRYIFFVFRLFCLFFLAGSTFLSAQSVSLEWDGNTESDLAGYNLYRSLTSGSGFVQINGNLIPTPSYSDNEVTGGESYYYTVTAVNTSGLESNFSNEVPFTAPLSNSAPVASDDSAQLFEDQAANIDVLANDGDADGDALIIVSVSQGLHGLVTITATNLIRYVPHADFNGTDAFTYTIDDGNGGTDTATVTVSVTPVNDAPVASDDSASTSQDQAVTVSVLANDSDVDGDTLSVSQVTQPANGSAAVDSSGTSVLYTPNAGFFGSDSFSYTASDGNGATASATVSVSVQQGNQAPQAADDSVSTPEDQALTIHPMKNDSDADGDIILITEASPAANGTVALTSSDSLLYTPNPDFDGTDSFTYTIDDGNGGTDTATVTVSVTPVNDAPVASDDSASTSQDQAVTVSVLANDSDVDGDTLSVSQVTQPANGSAAVESSGTSVLYTPNAGFSGSDSFSYTASDGNGGTASASVTIQVAASNPSPPGLLFPTHLMTNDRLLSDSFVSAAIVNLQSQQDMVVLNNFSEEGTLLDSYLLPEPLEPGQQVVLLVSELSADTSISSIVTVSGESGPIQGLCMVGDSELGRLDGLASDILAARELYFVIAQQTRHRSTLLSLHNPSSDPAREVHFHLFDTQGSLRGQYSTTLAPQGSIRATLAELFGESNEISEGYIKVESDIPLKGFEVVAGRKTFSLLAAQFEAASHTLFAPHFAVNNFDNNSVLRLLNMGDSATQVIIRAFNNDSQLLAQQEFYMDGGGLLVKDLRSLLSEPLKTVNKKQTLTGFLEIELQSADQVEPRFTGSLTFQTNRESAESTLPLVAEGRQELLFPHVVQSSSSGLFTGIAILNAGTETAELAVEVFDQQGNRTGRRELRLAPRSRISDLISSPTYFGSNFEQINGHIRLTSTRPVIPFVIFGDFEGNSLAAVEGQKPR